MNEVTLIYIVLLFAIWLVGYLNGLYVGSGKRLKVPTLVDILVLIGTTLVFVLIAIVILAVLQINI